MAQRRKWVTRGKRGQASELSEALNVVPAVADLLACRGYSSVTDAYRFLHPDETGIHDPFLLADMRKAVGRLQKALENGERIGVYGDYDVDGVTSAALLKRTLGRLAQSPDLIFARVPHRVRDGYGLSPDAVDQAVGEGCSVLISADCGISAHDAANCAREFGVDLIITDHHEPGDALPDALAVINPKRKDSDYPFRDLAGVGVAFKLCEALCQALGHNVVSYRDHYLDLVALGTVADSAPLIDENRVFVTKGLPLIVQTRKKGLQMLVNTMRRPISTSTISYQIGPRINAVGRVDDAAQALELLTTNESVRASELVALLERLNNTRREYQDRVQEESIAYIEQNRLLDDRVLLVVGHNWPTGVVGIVAGRLAEEYDRPAFVVSCEGTAARGSARSAGSFSVVEALKSCDGCLKDYGGHSQAAGFDAHVDKIPELRAQLNAYADSVLTDEDRVPTTEIDLELDASEIGSGLMADVAGLAPFGTGNPEPLWVCRNLALQETQRFRSANGNSHLRLKLSTGESSPLEAIWWKKGDLYDEIARWERVDIVFTLEANVGYGADYRLRLQDVEPAGGSESTRNGV